MRKTRCMGKACLRNRFYAVLLATLPVFAWYRSLYQRFIWQEWLRTMAQTFFLQNLGLLVGYLTRWQRRTERRRPSGAADVQGTPDLLLKTAVPLRFCSTAGAVYKEGIP